MNLANLALENIEKFGEMVSLVYEGGEYTNVQIHKEGDRFANGLRKLGLGVGDKIIVCAPNCPEILTSYGSILKLGSTIIPVLFLLQAEEIRYIMENSEARVVITSEELVDKIKAAADRVPSMRHIIVIGEKEFEGTLSFNKLVEENDDEFEVVEVGEDDLAAILYTSGTTGKPKGVMLSHHSLQVNALGSTGAITADEKDVSIVALPLAHAYGLTVLIGGFILGGKGVVLRWFDTQKVFELIEKYKVRIMTGVPTMYAFMLQFPDADKYDLSSMEIWISAAAPFPMENYKAFEEKFPGKILEGYGLTEAAPAVTVMRDDRPVKPGSAGVAIEGVKLEIRDDGDKSLPPGEVGEICVGGETVMKGYYKLPEATAETIIDGWLHTGDMGYLDEDGYLYVVDRKKDMIIRGGLNIYPSDIEEVLDTHPDVVEAAAVGVKDPTMGEEVKAFVVKKYGSKVTEEELIKFCQEKLAKYKTPKWVEFRSYLPKNSIGKILKKELRGE